VLDAPRRVRGAFDVHSLIGGVRVRREFLLACARHAARHIRRGAGEINFILVGDKDMSRLHKKYLGSARTTDVLAFDLTDNRRNPIDGDIYICVDQARRQARAYGVPLYEETARLAVHGVLHLAGFRDDSEAHRARMHDLEDRSLDAVRTGQ